MKFKIPKYNEKDYTDMLNSINPESLTSDEWFQISTSFKASGGDEAVWDEWNQKDPTRYNESENHRRWESLTEQGGITGATLHKKAKEYGYKHSGDGSFTIKAKPVKNKPDVIAFEKTIDINDLLYEMIPSEPNEKYHENQQIYLLQSLFNEDEYVSVVNRGTLKENDPSHQKYSPTQKGLYWLKSKDLVDKINKNSDDNPFYPQKNGSQSGYLRESGVWYCINPTDGEGRSKENITAYRHTLIESDDMPLEMQLAFYKASKLPIKLVIHSGSKSAHAIVLVNAPDEQTYKKRVKRIYDFCAANGFSVDQNNKNENRLSRFPGVFRGEKLQYILATEKTFENTAFKSYEEWEDWALKSAKNQKPIDVYVDGKKLTGQDDHKKESGKPNQPSIYSLFFDLDRHGNYILSTFKHEKFAFYLIEKYHIIRINKQLHIYKDGIYEYSEDLIESLMIDLIPVLKISHRKETLSIIRLKAPERTDDIKPEYMAYKNGVLNILTMDLLPFTPDLTLTYKIPFNYNPNAVCETASKALREIADNNDKRERLLKEVFGYCLYPSCEYEKMFVFMGTDGANGKSTILDWFKYSIGKSNYATVKPQDFSNRFSNISQYHKLANIMDDVSSASMDDTASATMRNLVSGNEIDVEQKGQPRFRMAPVATQIMACNKIPKFGKESYSATLRRLIIVDFPAEFSQEKGNVDVHLKQKLSTDAAAEWLIKESVQAFHDLLTRTDNHMIFTECAQDRYLLMDYKKDNDTFFGWIDYLMDTLETTDLASWFIGRQVKECHRYYLDYMREEMTGSDFVRLSLPNFSKRVQHEFRLTTHRPKVNGVKVSTFKSK